MTAADYFQPAFSLNLTLYVPAILLVVWISTIFATWIYRVTFHPLSKYPGPFWASITDNYGAYWASRGALHLNMWQAHQKYGKFVRYGPDKLLVNSDVGLHDIYDHAKNVKKSKAYRPIAQTMGRWTAFSTIDKQLYRLKRRVVYRWFSDDTIKAFAPTMLSLIRTFCTLLARDECATDQGWTRPKNMRDYCHWLAFDIMGDLLVGQKYRTLEDPTNRFIIDSIRDANMRIGIYSQNPSLIYLGWDLIWSPISRECRRKCMSWMKAMRTSLINQYHEEGAALSSAAVNPSRFKEGNGMAIEDISSEAQFLVAAGTETSATLLAALFFYLTRYPAAYAKLSDEIRGRFRDVEDIHSGPDLASCKYLNACINEALRMSPPAVGSHWREVESEGQCIDGEFVPGGYDVGTCIYAIHHNKEYFADSFDFAPERWIPGSDADREKLAAASNAFNPFSIGPRACIGRSLAMTETSVAFARVVWLMDFRRSDGDLGLVGEGMPGDSNGRHRVKEYQLASHLTSWSSGPMIEFRARKI